MKHPRTMVKCLFCVSAILCVAGLGLAQDGEYNTELTGYYQQYRNFSYNAGSGIDFQDTRFTGGGFSAAYFLAPWFAIWTQVSMYGSTETIVNPIVIPGIPIEDTGFPLKVRVINNLQGIRYQTKEYGPFRFYGKAGVGFSNFGFQTDTEEFGANKLSVGYGGGAQIWLHKNVGVTLDLSHITMGVPQLSNQIDRDKWDSGLVYTSGLSFRF